MAKWSENTLPHTHMCTQLYSAMMYNISSQVMGPNSLVWAANWDTAEVSACVCGSQLRRQVCRSVYLFCLTSSCWCWTIMNEVLKLCLCVFNVNLLFRFVLFCFTSVIRKLFSFFLSYVCYVILKYVCREEKNNKPYRIKFYFKVRKRTRVPENINQTKHHTIYYHL